MQKDILSRPPKSLGPRPVHGPWATSAGQILNRLPSTVKARTRPGTMTQKSSPSPTRPSGLPPALRTHHDVSRPASSSTCVDSPPAPKYHKSVNTFIAESFTSNNVVLRREYQRKFIIHRHRVEHIEQIRPQMAQELTDVPRCKCPFSSVDR